MGDRLTQYISPKWLGRIAGLVAVFVIFIFMEPNRPLRLVVGAPPYVWPQGCPQLDYQRIAFDVDPPLISCTCADENYRIQDWKERGLHPAGRGNVNFYRVGSDALQIDKILWGRYAGQCRIWRASPSFYQSRPGGYHPD
jgi:hypothetical protein